MSTEPREFYVNVTEHSWGYSDDYWSRSQKETHDIVRVIEHSAYQALEQKLAVAVEALENIGASCPERYIHRKMAAQALALIKPDAKKAGDE